MRYHAGPSLVDHIVTVGGTDDDFSTIQKAIDWFKRYRIRGDCRIDVDAATYDEAMVFDELLIDAGATLTLLGDARELAGLSYVDGADCNQAGLTNGGSGACGLANAGNDITVTGGGGNPDFDADGWDSGDTILVYDNAGATTEETIDSVLNNVITLTAAAPAVGNDGTAICLLPNRRIERTAAGPCIDAFDIQGVQIRGFYLVTATGLNCHGVRCRRTFRTRIRNVAVSPEDRGIQTSESPSYVDVSDGAVSVWDAAYGVVADYGSVLDATYLVAVDCSVGGLYVETNGTLIGDSSIAVNCANGYDARTRGLLEADGATARQNTTGYDAQFGAYIYAPSTNANNNGNGADYDPLPAGFPGSNQGNHYAVVYAS